MNERLDNGIKFIFKSANGFYSGFIVDSYLFSRDGIYLGWVEGNFVWNSNGTFRGVITNIGQHYYIVFNRFTMLPSSRTPKPAPAPVSLPQPPAHVSPINLPVEYSDTF